ncbi:MAG TPA: hypothetical protein VEH27_11785 [Methylomirabilota bacterium]|nr:hypothetical protein [Methylomirabilota bacterium]
MREKEIQALADKFVHELTAETKSSGAALFKRLLSQPWARRGLEESIIYHARRPEMTLGEYGFLQLHALVGEVHKKVLVYLDINHWIRLRDAALQRSEDARYQALLELLRSLHAAERIVCPASFELFAELVKQGDPKTRQATARLMDELSSGLCLHNPRGVITAEFY